MLAFEKLSVSLRKFKMKLFWGIWFDMCPIVFVGVVFIFIHD